MKKNYQKKTPKQAERYIEILALMKHYNVVEVVQDDQKASVHLIITVQKTPKNILNSLNHTIDDLKMAVIEYILNVDRAVLNSADRTILNTVFENTVRCVNKCLETGGGHFEHYL
jgi:flagellar biosynthesis/type III secretory pathway ATPase